ncbi:MAG: hypothetical protein DSM106950_01320 [Stigonema ocellatum SAG 48.90 = DSM 106950]|nr:hypothetical protein [Stigonema ocellatum SAG 48.90 = DSM 106950]
MNEPITVTSPMPDPSWDYYDLYVSILDAKARFDELLNSISKQNSTNETADTKFRSALHNLTGEIQEIIDNFLSDQEDIYDE